MNLKPTPFHRGVARGAANIAPASCQPRPAASPGQPASPSQPASPGQLPAPASQLPAPASRRSRPSSCEPRPAAGPGQPAGSRGQLPDPASQPAPASLGTHLQSFTALFVALVDRLGWEVRAQPETLKGKASGGKCQPSGCRWEGRKKRQHVLHNVPCDPTAP